MPFFSKALALLTSSSICMLLFHFVHVKLLIIISYLYIYYFILFFELNVLSIHAVIQHSHVVSLQGEDNTTERTSSQDYSIPCVSKDQAMPDSCHHWCNLRALSILRI